MKDPGGILEVRLTPDEIVADRRFSKGTCQPARDVRLTVTDTGAGIDPAALPRIFEPYFTTKRMSEGTGLGLAVAHGIVKSHQGTITVNSEPGEGSQFHVLLPAIAEGPAEAKTTPPDLKESGPLRSTGCR